MTIFALVALLYLPQIQSQANVAGTWQWRGSAGWQRIEMNFEVDGSRLSGIVRMGPGSGEPATPDDFWEYFFDAVDFRIEGGAITGNEIRFDHQTVRLRFPAILAGLQSAGSVESLRFTYKGIIVEGDQILMTREIVPGKNGTATLGTHKVEFILKRVK